MRVDRGEQGGPRMEQDLRLRIRRVQHIEPWIRVHPDAGRVLLRTSDGICECRCGISEVQVRAITDHRLEADVLEISERVLDLLSVPVLPAHVQAWIRPGEVVIGPLIGVLANPRWNDKAHTVRPSQQLPAIQKLLEIGAEEGALCYVLGARDIDFQRMRATGFLWDGRSWTRHILPLPDTIYDQVISRKLEFQKQHQQARRRLSELYGPRIFNDGFFDKWQIHQWLSQDPATRTRTPATQRATSLQGMAQFMEKHPVTFFKPIHGSLGLGIIRVQRLASGYQYAMKRARGDPRTGHGSTSLEVARALRRVVLGRPYVMQQGIEVALYRTRPFDVRILLQRDGTGEWKRTKAFVRVAKAGDFTSNLRSGGEALPMDTVFREVFPGASQARRVRRSILRLARDVAETMERQSGKRFGELGVDLGVDQHGNAWVIEVNSKPWKTPDTVRGRRDLVDLAFRRPMAYAIHLALTS